MRVLHPPDPHLHQLEREHTVITLSSVAQEHSSEPFEAVALGGHINGKRRTPLVITYERRFVRLGGLLPCPNCYLALPRRGRDHPPQTHAHDDDWTDVNAEDDVRFGLDRALGRRRLRLAGGRRLRFA
jgi:hypothetical protein